MLPRCKRSTSPSRPAAGATPEAVPAWAEAAQACAAAGLAWDEAYARWRAAEACLPRRSDRAAGTAHLRRAHDMATELGAAPLLEQIQALATSAGIALHRRQPRLRRR